jgi:hypothetical protein
MKIQIKYIYKGDEREVVTLPADLIQWERTTKRRIAQLYALDADKNVRADIGIEDLSVMVWAVERRNGETAPFDEWVKNLDDLLEFEEVAVNPTKAAVSTESE